MTPVSEATGKINRVSWIIFELFYLFIYFYCLAFLPSIATVGLLVGAWW